MTIAIIVNILIGVGFLLILGALATISQRQEELIDRTNRAESILRRHTKDLQAIQATQNRPLRQRRPLITSQDIASAVGVYDTK